MEVIFWIVLLGFAILVTALVVSLYYRRKYAPIFRQLSELLADQETVVTNKTAEKPAERTDNAVESADADLYKQLTEAIRNEQLYTVQKFGRTELVERFHLSSKRISTAFSVNGTSVPEFIRECRLEHARQLMVERPDMSLVEIATASGFIHASTFTVDFKNKYGVSPTKYREEKQKEKNVVQRE
jgi:AraC-like DNA-binding protein